MDFLPGLLVERAFLWPEVSIVPSAILINGFWLFGSSCWSLICRCPLYRRINGYLWFMTHKAITRCSLRLLGIVIVDDAHKTSESTTTWILRFSMVQSHMSHPILTTSRIDIGLVLVLIGPFAGLSPIKLGLVSLFGQVEVQLRNLCRPYLRISWFGLFILFDWFYLDLLHVHLGRLLLGCRSFFARMEAVHWSQSSRAIANWGGYGVFSCVVNRVVDCWLFV